MLKRCLLEKLYLQSVHFFRQFLQSPVAGPIQEMSASKLSARPFCILSCAPGPSAPRL